MLSPTPLPPSHSQQQTVDVATTNISNMNVSSLIIGPDKPKRRFSFLNTQIHNPLNKTYQIPPKPSSMLVATNAANTNTNTNTNTNNNNNKTNNNVVNMNMNNVVNNLNVNNNNTMNNGMNNVYNMYMDNIRKINRKILNISTCVSF